MSVLKSRMARSPPNPAPCQSVILGAPPCKRVPATNCRFGFMRPTCQSHERAVLVGGHLHLLLQMWLFSHWICRDNLFTFC
ncbi:hypothetical protein Y032_0265g644 [Ancylostoma ceylanicum]|uniref:Uncharacterized protein n=1 Tax=Ancylostoma ceylanicum TaxID=53326 RepID=A0A016S9H4_9BILA|nr:hypothetical protein Y032_0265g644 [Ancylostoma ceylanicum]